MRPANALKAILKGHGLTVYDYPDDSHLSANTPEDHTPFSVTGWPIASKFGIGHALDVMPRSDAPNGRAENAALARQLIRDRDAGNPGVMWIKYINWTDENGVCQQVRWEDKRTTRASTDKGHIHISGRSDCDNDDRADNYDPFGDNDMAGFPSTDDALALMWRMHAIVYGRETVAAGPKQGEEVWVVKRVNELSNDVRALVTSVNELRESVNTLAAKVDTIPQADGGSVSGTYTVTKVNL